MKKYFVFLIILISCTKNIKKSDFNDIVYLKNGEEILCDVISMDKEKIIIQVESGKKEVKIQNVSSVDLGKKREGSEWRKIEDINDDILKEAIKTNLSEFQGLGYINIYCEKYLKIERDSTYTYSLRIIRGITDENGRDAGNVSFYYRKNNEKIYVDFGRTVTKEGEILHIRDNAIEDASIYSRFPSYENTHELKFALNKSLPGNFIDFKVSIKGRFTDDNQFIFDEILGDKGLILKGKIVIQYPEDFSINYEYFNTVNPEIEKKDGNIYLIWNFNEIPPVIDEPNLPPLRYFLPRIVASLDYEWNSIASLFKGKMEGEMNIDKDIYGIYEEILRGIKFVNISSLSSYVFPKNASQIMREKIGNMLDKGFLFYLALKSKGKPCDMILTRSKEYGEISEKVPSLLQFDGAIIFCDGKYFDLSYETMPFGFIRNEYQGTKGLSIEKGSIVYIPYIKLDEQNSFVERDVILKDNGDAEIKDIWSFKGDDVIDFRGLKDLKKEEMDIFVQRFVNNFVKNAEIKDYRFYNLDSLNNSVKLSVSYNVKKLGIIQGRFILFNLPGINYSSYSVGKAERMYPLFLENISRSENRIRIKIPKNYKLRGKPDDFTFKREGYGFYSRIIEKKDFIEYYDRFENIVNIINLKDYPDYRECIMCMAKIPSKWFILERVK